METRASTETIIEPAEAAFKADMAHMRAALAAEIEALRSESPWLGNANRVTILCMVIAATRGHLHAQGVWRKMQGWEHHIPDLAAQRAFVAEHGNQARPDGSGKWLKALSDEELRMALALIDAAEEWRSRPAPVAAEVEPEVTVPVAAVV